MWIFYSILINSSGSLGYQKGLFLLLPLLIQIDLDYPDPGIIIV
jgi:hypothetical protein